MGVRRTLKPRAYGIGNGSINLAPRPIIAQRDPTSRDIAELGTTWINPNTNSTWTITSVVAGSASWVTSPASGVGVFSSVEVTGGAGTVFKVDAGNSTMAGDLTVAGNTTTGTLHSGTATFSGFIDIPAFAEGALITNSSGQVSTIDGTAGFVLTANAPGTAPSFQAAAGGSISITGDTGGALSGSAFTFSGGSTGLSFGGSGSTETLTFAGITANGGTVNLATDATVSAVNVGTGGAAKTVVIGSVDNGSSTTIRSGDGDLGLNASTASSGNIIIGNADTTVVNICDANANNSRTTTINTGNVFGQTDSVIILDGPTGGSGAKIFEVLSGTSSGAGTQTLNLGNAVGGTLDINMGNGDNTTAQTINIASGAAAADSTVSILAGNASAGNQVFNVMSGTATGGTQNIGIGTGNSVTTIGIGNGGAAAANNITIGGAGACVVRIADLQAAGSLAMGSTMTTGTVAIGGSGSSSTTLKAGTGAINFDSAGLVTTQFGTDSQASPTATATINKNFGQATFTGFTTAAAGAQIFTITNSLVTASSALLVTVANVGTNDAQMTMTRVKPAAGSFTVDTINNGAAALNGDLLITFWLLA